MTYHTFQIAIATNNGLKFLSVVACDMQSAKADVIEAYGSDVDIVSVSVL